MNLKSTLRYLPLIIINGYLLISILFFNMDTKSVITLFFIEIGIFAIFSFIRRLGQTNKVKEKGAVSPKTKAITELILVLLTVLIFLILLTVGFFDENFQEMLRLLKQNILIIAIMLFLEFIELMNYFKRTYRYDNSFHYSYTKLFILFGLLFPARYFDLIFPMQI
jgi:hypothetical protein